MKRRSFLGSLLAAFAPAPLPALAPASPSAMHVVSSGNVGLGTTTPMMVLNIVSTPIKGTPRKLRMPYTGSVRVKGD